MPSLTGNFHDTLKSMNSIKYYFTLVLNGDAFTIKMLQLYIYNLGAFLKSHTVMTLYGCGS